MVPTWRSFSKCVNIAIQPELSKHGTWIVVFSVNGMSEIISGNEYTYTAFLSRFHPATVC